MEWELPQGMKFKLMPELLHDIELANCREMMELEGGITQWLKLKLIAWHQALKIAA
ncbi:MAG: hypothetical protein LBU51_06200 [Bacteroidales bacterium]|jgi:hypothetical protein|nr:hypothetical protein [Bacteroidales bacterium]